MNKRGWIKIVEAFVAILLIAAVMLMVINKEYIEKKDPSEQIYEDEVSILREIETNQTLRNDILDLSTLPTEWANFPEKVKNKITDRIPAYLGCEGKICSLNDDCVIDTSIEEDVYVKSVVIAGNLETYSPRQLKLFCWVI